MTYYISQANGYISCADSYFSFFKRLGLFYFLLCGCIVRFAVFLFRFHHQVGEFRQLFLSPLCCLHPYLLYVFRGQYSVFLTTASVQYSFDKENYDNSLYLPSLHFPFYFVGKDQALLLIPKYVASLLVYFTKQLQYDCRALYSVFCLYHFHCVLFHKVLHLECRSSLFIYIPIDYRTFYFMGSYFLWNSAS